jgi:hypothetical protein
MKMTIHNDDYAPFRELSVEELDKVAGGDWSWGDLAKAMGGGAFTGGLGGAAAVGPAGAVPGAIGGGLLGGIGYCLHEIF